MTIFYSTSARLLAGTLAVLICLASAASAEIVSCDSLTLSFDPRGMQPSCESGSIQSGRNRTNWESINLETPGIAIAMQFDRVDSRSYMPKETVRDNVDVDEWFTRSRNWSNAYELEGYEIQDFEGNWDGSTEYWLCVGFARYRSPTVGAPGYRERLVGSYCVDPSDGFLSDEVEKFLRSISY